MYKRQDDYGPDIFTDFIVDFIDKNKDDPFFIYYPMALVHDPFLPTPDSDDWRDLEKRNKGNKPIYFSDMLTYMDKIVGRISNALEKNKLENTILIFIGDNGTDTKVVTLNKGVEIRGAKGSTIKYASNVPMIVNWKSQIKQGFNSDAMIDFTDFYATFEDILNLDYQQSYGKSILPLMTNNNYNERDVLITYYDPIWGDTSMGRGVYAQNKEYKLYKNGSFFNFSKDLYEKNPIDINKLSETDNEIYSLLKTSLDSIPDLPEYNHNGWIERRKQVNESRKFNNIWQLNTK